MCTMLGYSLRLASADVPVLLGVNALPFGAVGSVAAFLRVSTALWYIGFVGMSICWTSFFDDYSVASRKDLLANTAWAVETLFSLVGFTYAKEGSKAPEFADCFKMLGLVIDCSRVLQNEILVGHTAERRQELAAALSQVLEQRSVSSKDVERLRGRMLFFESYTFGRTANLAIQEFGRLCLSAQRHISLKDGSLVYIQQLLDRVNEGEPIVISSEILDTWFVFTDGACEGEMRVGSVGGVLISPSHHIIEHFGEEVPSALMKIFLEDSRNPIHELELLPVLISVRIWSEKIKRSQLVLFVDNDSRMALIRGSGETRHAKTMISEVTLLETRLQLKTWYARVPSFSNLADDPSRLCFELLRRQQSKQVPIDWNAAHELVTSKRGE
eukprot:s1454_g18.t1